MSVTMPWQRLFTPSVVRLLNATTFMLIMSLVICQKSAAESLLSTPGNDNPPRWLDNLYNQRDIVMTRYSTFDNQPCVITSSGHDVIYHYFTTREIDIDIIKRVQDRLQWRPAERVVPHSELDPYWENKRDSVPMGWREPETARYPLLDTPAEALELKPAIVPAKPVKFRKPFAIAHPVAYSAGRIMWKVLQGTSMCAQIYTAAKGN